KALPALLLVLLAQGALLVLFPLLQRVHQQGVQRVLVQQAWRPPLRRFGSLRVQCHLLGSFVLLVTAWRHPWPPSRLGRSADRGAGRPLRAQPSFEPLRQSPPWPCPAHRVR